MILNANSIATKFTTTDIAATPDLSESPRRSEMALPPTQSQSLIHIAGDHIATASFRPRPPPEWYLATHRGNYIKRLYFSPDGHRGGQASGNRLRSIHH